MRRKSMQYCFLLYSSVNDLDNASSLPPVSLLNYICARCGRGNPSPTEICVRLRISIVGTGVLALAFGKLAKFALRTLSTVRS